MKTKNLQSLAIFCAVVATAAHFVRADGKFLFSDKGNGEYVHVIKASKSPLRFAFERCSAEGGACKPLGKESGYTMEDIRIPYLKLTAKRETGKLSTAQARDMELLDELINGIERPRPRFGGALTYVFKGSIADFEHLVKRSLPKGK